jgi:hypothetical protein
MRGFAWREIGKEMPGVKNDHRSALVSLHISRNYLIIFLFSSYLMPGPELLQWINQP